MDISLFSSLCYKEKTCISLLHLLAQDIIEVRVQFYVVLLEIPIQLICAQDLCDANQLEQKGTLRESRSAGHYFFEEAELPKSKSSPSGNIPDGRNISLKTSLCQMCRKQVSYTRH